MDGNPVDCNALGIPINLHSNGRGIDPAGFQPDHLLYRRYKKMPGKSHEESIAETISTKKSLSANWDKHCLNANDVLYTENGVYHKDHGIVAYCVEDIRGWSYVHEEFVFTLEFEHSPLPCIYPHCDMHIRCNGGPISGVPGKVKTVVRVMVAGLAKKIRDGVDVSLTP
ncbi:MAG: hypothetical protein ABIR47_03615 [Candidatus Kapaibacterium sp.]